jgi:hypothetical protein
VNLFYVIQDGQNGWSVVNLEMELQGSVKCGEVVDKTVPIQLVDTN